MNVPLGLDTGLSSGDESGRALLAMAGDGPAGSGHDAAFPAGTGGVRWQDARKHGGVVRRSVNQGVLPLP